MIICQIWFASFFCAAPKLPGKQKLETTSDKNQIGRWTLWNAKKCNGCQIVCIAVFLHQNARLQESCGMMHCAEQESFRGCHSKRKQLQLIMTFYFFQCGSEKLCSWSCKIVPPPVLCCCKAAGHCFLSTRQSKAARQKYVQISSQCTEWHEWHQNNFSTTVCVQFSVTQFQNLFSDRCFQSNTSACCFRERRCGSCSC